MTLFGLEIRRATKAAVQPVTWPTTVSNLGGWLPTIRESFAGAWQRNLETRPENVLSFAAVFACVTLIASDIGKLRIRLVEKDEHGIWNEIENPAYSPVLRKPNHYQTRITFFENWITSKLIHGNTYVLKQRDHRGVVSALYVLDPTRVRALVSANGDVYYQLYQDNLSGQDRDSTALVPASEIIHDVMVALYHPLCGVSPMSACGLAALQGLGIQQHSSDIFENGAQPGGILTTPGSITPELAKKMQLDWEANYGGHNAGRIAVLAGQLTYQQIPMMNATDAQLIEQLRWTAENVCTAFHVPPYMIGVGPPPSYNNIEALNQQYYAQCLQNKIEKIELLLDEGLGLSTQLGTEFDLDDLLRMDTPSRVKAASDSIGSGAVAPNEARKRWFGLSPVPGGDSPYMQQQNYSLEALAKRDAQADPFAKPKPEPAAPNEPEPTGDLDERMQKIFRRDMLADWAA